MSLPRFFTSKEVTWPAGNGAIGQSRVLCEDDRLRVLTHDEALNDPEVRAAIAQATALTDRRPAEVVAWQDAALNEVLVLAVPAGVALTAPVLVLHSEGDDAARSVLIVMGSGSRAAVNFDLQLSGTAAAEDIQLVLGTGAVLEARRFVTGEGAQFAMARGTVAAEAHLAWAEFQAGDGFRQSLSEFRLEGSGATLRYRCGAVGSGCLSFDEACRAAVAAPDAKADLCSWTVLSAGDKAVSGGRVSLRRGTSGAVGHQRTNGLLLARHASFIAQPDLEAEHGDLSGGHGAAVSGLDADSLFYLQSRGLDDQLARRVLAAAFLSEATAAFDGSGFEERLSATINSAIV